MNFAVGDEGVMARMHTEAAAACKREKFMCKYMHRHVLDHTSWPAMLSHLLAAKIADSELGVDDWYTVLSEVFTGSLGDYDPNLGSAATLAAQDLVAVEVRDAACVELISAFLFYKGFHAIQTHRAAHVLWQAGRKNTAYLIQARANELFGVDFHPAATVGAGLLIDHATGIVVGETAVIGCGCSFLHGVTLGGTGKEGRGDRHPKIGNNVLVGCNATLLGNVVVGNNCKIGSGTMLLKDLAPGTTVVGNPARVVGMTTSKCSGGDMDHALRDVLTPQGHSYVYGHDEQGGASTCHSTTFTRLVPPPRSKSSDMLSMLAMDDFALG